MSFFVSTGLFAFVVLLITCNAGSSQAQTLVPGSCGPSSCRAGDCEQYQSGYMCHCFGNIKGPDCSTLLVIPPDNACSSNPCWGGGTCRVVSNTWVCDCPPGRTGKDCRTIDPAVAALCNPNPCKNGAVCSIIGSKATCSCTNGWTGPFCDTATNTVVNCNAGANPCFNGATCDKDANKCQCSLGFTGTFCQTYVELPKVNVVKVKNLGWYVAGLELYYEYQDSVSGKKIGVAEKASIAALQEHAFRIPQSAAYDSRGGVNLISFAYLGKEIFNLRLPNQYELCLHVWGTTLINHWSRMNC